MLWRWPARHRGIHRLGVLFVILGLVHTPLPQPDFHNIRHHDGPGEVCEHHDHLLRWHPGAGRADDVSVLHWHWFLPTAEPLGPIGESHGPALHAHVVDWQAWAWDEGPRVSADTTVRLAATLAADPSPHPLYLILPEPVLLVEDGSAARRVRAFSATFAPAAPLACLFQRWDC